MEMFSARFTRVPFFSRDGRGENEDLGRWQSREKLIEFRRKPVEIPCRFFAFARFFEALEIVADDNALRGMRPGFDSVFSDGEDLDSALSRMASAPSFGLRRRAAGYCAWRGSDGAHAFSLTNSREWIHVGKRKASINKRARSARPPERRVRCGGGISFGERDEGRMACWASPRAILRVKMCGAGEKQSSGVTPRWPRLRAVVIKGMAPKWHVSASRLLGVGRSRVESAGIGPRHTFQNDIRFLLIGNPRLSP